MSVVYEEIVYWLSFLAMMCVCLACECQQRTAETREPLLKPFVSDSEKFVLVISLYNEQRPQRIKEFITCLEENLKNPRIAHLHVIYECSSASDYSVLDYVLSKDISIEFVRAKPSFGLIFDLINKYYSGEKIILSNADIYFNETLGVLDHYDLTNKFLALTRWNVNRNGSLALHSKVKNTYSQDTWVFKAPIKRFQDASMLIGTCGCDNKIAFQAAQAGLIVINPCLSVQCCHLHLSNLRNYDKCLGFGPSEHDFMFIDWSYLDGSVPDSIQLISPIANGAK